MPIPSKMGFIFTGTNRLESYGWKLETENKGPFRMNDSVQFEEQIIASAKAHGFDLFGIVVLGDDGGSEFEESKHFEEWVNDGRHGEMQYLATKNDAGDLKRTLIGNSAPWAKSAIVVAVNYNSAQPYSVEAAKEPDAKSRGWISRYAWSASVQDGGATDYHDAVLTRLRKVEAEICKGYEQRFPQQKLRTWCYVDTGPIQERMLARHAGIGWVGKNCCIIHPEMGSWMYLGVMLTSYDLRPERNTDVASKLQPDRCGSCTRCIDACPTDALTEPYKMDARRCISYLTIEKRGDIQEDLRSMMGNHLFGCDICQDVCPWNGAVDKRKKPPTSSWPEFQARTELVAPELTVLAEMTRDEFHGK